LRSLIEALRKDDLIRVLAEPTLMTLAGRPASLRVGGELPYRTKDSQGKYVTKFKEYGTRVDVLPILLSSQRIHLDVRFRVSKPDEADLAHEGIQNVAALDAYEVETGIDVRSGETRMIDVGVDRHDVAVNVSPANDGENADASGAPVEARHSINEVETIALVTAEIVTKNSAIAGKPKPVVQR